MPPSVQPTPSAPVPNVPPKSRPSTRTSIRHSLNLASMGKALADAIHKDPRDDADKAARKARDASGRRMSGAVVAPAARPRASIGERSSMSSRDSPELRTAARANRATRLAITSSEESSRTSDSSPRAAPTLRRMSLRARPPVASVAAAPVASALPKYRPRSVLMDADKVNISPSSPVRPGVRRRLSTSDEESEAMKEGNTIDASKAKSVTRPISPMPKRTALKANLSAAVNASPSTPTKRQEKMLPPAPRSSSPSRPPSKAQKKTPASSSSGSAILRPSSSASVRSGSVMRPPRTPQTPTSVRSAAGLMRTPPASVSKGTAAAGLLNTRSPTRDRSPSGKRMTPGSSTSAKSNSSTPLSDTTLTPTAGLFSEGNSTDSVDVEMLLSAVISPTAPTPAMPRIQFGGVAGDFPETPTRAPGHGHRVQGSGSLPARENLSYLSPDASTYHLRPQQARVPGRDRGSILSWEQLAADSSKTLGDGEVDALLCDIPAPFRSGAVSPSPSFQPGLLPDSPGPNLSILRSPGEFAGSISQVLLPDSTPSPAPARRDFFASSGGRGHGHGHSQSVSHAHSPAAKDTDVPAVDAAIVTLLRLQVASAEGVARDRLATIGALEDQLHDAKATRTAEVAELAKQVARLDEQLRSTLGARERGDAERAAAAAALEERMRAAEKERVRAVEEAQTQARARAQKAVGAALAGQQRRWVAAGAAKEAAGRWETVRDVAESELELIRSNRETLAVLLAGLDNSLARLASDATA